MPVRWRLDIGAVFVYLVLGAAFSAVPRYVTEQLDGSRAMAGLGVSIFFVAAVIARPLAGRLIDTRGRRPVLVVAPFVVAAMMVALLAADHVGLVLVIRFLQGLAGGAFYVAAVTAETDMAPRHRRASAVARFSIAVYTGFAVGPVLGEVLSDVSPTATWLALAALAALGGSLSAGVPETLPAPVEPEPGDLPPPRVSIIHPAAVLPGITLMTLGVGYASITAMSALYARSIGMGSSGALYATFAITILVLRLGAGRLADRVGLVRVMFPGLSAFALGWLLLAVLRAPLPAIIGVALVGVGWAVVFPAVLAWLSDQVPDVQRGAALGTVMAFMDIGQGAGGYVVGAVADAANFGWAYAVPGLLTLLGTAVLALAVNRSARSRPQVV